MATTRTRKNAGVATPYSHHSLNRSGGDATVPGGKEVVERMLSARRLTSLLSRSSTTTKAEVNGFGNRQKETKTLLTRRWREPDSNLYGAFPVKSYFWFVAGSLFGAGKPFFVPLPAIRFAERAEGVKGPKR